MQVTQLVHKLQLIYVLSRCTSVNWWLNMLYNLTPYLKVFSSRRKQNSFPVPVSAHSKTSAPNAQMSKSKSHSLLEIGQLDSLWALFQSPLSPNLVCKEDIQHAWTKIPPRCNGVGSDFPLHRLSLTLTRCTQGERVRMSVRHLFPQEDFHTLEN